MPDFPEKDNKISVESVGWRVLTEVLFSHMEELRDLRQNVGQFNAKAIFSRYDDKAMVAAYNNPSNDIIG